MERCCLDRVPSFDCQFPEDKHLTSIHCTKGMSARPIENRSQKPECIARAAAMLEHYLKEYSPAKRFEMGKNDAIFQAIEGHTCNLRFHAALSSRAGSSPEPYCPPLASWLATPQRPRFRRWIRRTLPQPRCTSWPMRPKSLPRRIRRISPPRNAATALSTRAKPATPRPAAIYLPARACLRAVGAWSGFKRPADRGRRPASRNDAPVRI